MVEEAVVKDEDTWEELVDDEREARQVDDDDGYRHEHDVIVLIRRCARAAFQRRAFSTGSHELQNF